jgi:hypothetical protein
MEKMIAFCGLVFTDCPAYLATQRDDDVLRAKTAANWSQMFGVDIKPEAIHCDGCLATSGRLFHHCTVCEVRLCGLERGVLTCAHCGDYGCERITKFMEMAPEAKESLEAVRVELNR